VAAARARTGGRRRSPAATRLALEGLVSPPAGLEALWAAPIAWGRPGGAAPARTRPDRGRGQAVRLPPRPARADRRLHRPARRPLPARPGPARRDHPPLTPAVSAGILRRVDEPSRCARAHIAGTRVIARDPLVA
jgi:hypothetical protein